MPFNTFLNHTCDIYHINKTESSLGFGLVDYHDVKYHDIPDLSAIQCHFCTGSGSRSIEQNKTQDAPNANYQAKIKLVLPINTDVRLNDKIIDNNTGYEYTADIPIKIQNHHIFVMLRRTLLQEAL